MPSSIYWAYLSVVSEAAVLSSSEEKVKHTTMFPRLEEMFRKGYDWEKKDRQPFPLRTGAQHDRNDTRAITPKM